MKSVVVVASLLVLATSVIGQEWPVFLCTTHTESGQDWQTPIPTRGQVAVVVIYCSLSPEPPTQPMPDWAYTVWNAADVKSIPSYFRIESYSTLELVPMIVENPLGPYLFLPRQTWTPGDIQSQPENYFNEVIPAVDEVFNFNDADLNNDGVVDAIAFVIPAQGWAGRTFEVFWAQLDDKTGGMCVASMADNYGQYERHRAVLAHEFTHGFTSSFSHHWIGGYCPMSLLSFAESYTPPYGSLKPSFANPFARDLFLGWLKPVRVTEPMYNVQIPLLDSDSTAAFKLGCVAESTNAPTQYFLLTYSTWEHEYNVNWPRKGFAIYNVRPEDRVISMMTYSGMWDFDRTQSPPVNTGFPNTISGRDTLSFPWWEVDWGTNRYTFQKWGSEGDIWLPEPGQELFLDSATNPLTNFPTVAPPHGASLPSHVAVRHLRPDPEFPARYGRADLLVNRGLATSSKTRHGDRVGTAGRECTP